MSSVVGRRSAASRASAPRRAASRGRAAVVALPPRRPREVRWQVDERGRIVNFDLKTLRTDILRRLQLCQPLYTLEECRTLILEVVRVATAWQEEELASLVYLADVHERFFSVAGRPLNFQWPLADTEPIPFAVDAAAGAVGGIATLAEEINRSLVRLIDRVWSDRRERLLLAARLLDDLQPLLVRDGADGG